MDHHTANKILLTTLSGTQCFRMFELIQFFFKRIYPGVVIGYQKHTATNPNLECISVHCSNIGDWDQTELKHFVSIITDLYSEYQKRYIDEVEDRMADYIESLK